MLYGYYLIISCSLQCGLYSARIGSYAVSSGYEQAKAELRRIERGEVVIAFGPPA
jgi:hypothetical protein